MIYTIGIDPGLTGAVCCLQHGRFYKLDDLPVQWHTASVKAKKRELDAVALWKLLFTRYPGIDVTAYVEHGTFLQSRVSAYSMGDGNGVIRGVLASQQIPVQRVKPVEWKKYFGLLKADKRMSISKAQELFPTAPIEGKDGRAEALLIARYGWERGKSS